MLERFKLLLRDMNRGIYEKETEISLSLLAALAGESVILLGPPGVAKSMVARQLKCAFRGARNFEYLMSRFSTPDEIFGPVSIQKLKTSDTYERAVDGYLPTADVVFLDEIWKAGPAIQNALLTAINERIFKNGSETLHLPMKALIAASNELPTEDEGLEALWDRFLVRMVSNCISSEKIFYKMVRSKSIEEPVIAENYLVDDALYLKWLSAIQEVEITDEVCRLVTHIRKTLAEQQKKEEITTLDYYISDRRWKKIFHLMQTSAFLNGRNAINVTDSILLIHCLWNKVEAIPVVLEAVSSAITADLDGKITQNVKALDKLIGQLSANMRQGRVPIDSAKDDYVVMNYFYYIVEGFQKEPCLFARFDYNHIDTKKSNDGILYYEEKSKSWIIHAIYTGAPFDYKKSSNGKNTKIKLQKCKDGIMVDGIPYLFRKKGWGTFISKSEVPTSTSADIIFLECASIRNDFEHLKTLFYKDCNLFVSDDDIKLIGKQLDKTEKALKNLEIKVQNTKLLMLR